MWSGLIALVTCACALTSWYCACADHVTARGPRASPTDHLNQLLPRHYQADHCLLYLNMVYLLSCEIATLNMQNLDAKIITTIQYFLQLRYSLNND